MNKNTAERIVATFQGMTREIDDNIRDAMNKLSADEFTLYRRAAGKIMGNFF